MPQISLKTPANYPCVPIDIQDPCYREFVERMTNVGRACLGDLALRIDLEIDLRTIGLLRDIVSFLSVQIQHYTDLRGDMTTQIECIDAAIKEGKDFLLNSPCSPVRAMIDMFEARRGELLVLLAQISQLLDPALGLSVQLDGWSLLEQSMLCQKKNAQDILALIDEIEHPEPPVPPGPECPPV